MRDGANWAVQREQQRQRELRQRQQELARVHTRAGAHQQLQDGMSEFKGRETEALAQMAGIKVLRVATGAAEPGDLGHCGDDDGACNRQAGRLLQHRFPEQRPPGRDEEYGEGWYATSGQRHAVLPLDDGRAVPTFRAYSAGEPAACKQEHCADRVSFGAVLAKEFPNAGIDFSWTPRSPNST